MKPASCSRLSAPGPREDLHLLHPVEIILLLNDRAIPVQEHRAFRHPPRVENPPARANENRRAAIMRVLVHLRETLALHKGLARKLTELERRLEGYDQASKSLVDAIRQLAAAPTNRPEE